MAKPYMKITSPRLKGISFAAKFCLTLFMAISVFALHAVASSAGNKHIRPASSDASLSALTVDIGKLTQAISPGVTSYTILEGNATTEFELKALSTDPAATVRVDGKILPATDGILYFPQVGNTIVTIVVTAQDGATTRTYTITINRATATDSNAGLSKIATNAPVSLSQVPGADYRDYVIIAPLTLTSITITSTTVDPRATIKLNGVPEVSGVASQIIPIPLGNTVLKTVVMAADSVTTKTYSITVMKNQSSDAEISEIDANPYSVLNQVPGPDFKDYAFSVPNSQSSVTLTPEAGGPGDVIYINGVNVAPNTASPPIPLAVGVNKVNIVSTAQDGVTTLTYGVTITRAAAGLSTNASLSTITTSAGTVSQIDANDFGISVPNATSGITITPTAADPTATITINGITFASGAASPSIPLTVGAQDIYMFVTAQDNATVKVYRLTVDRGILNDATLSRLTTNTGVALTKVTGSDYKDYVIAVPSTLTAMQITATTENPAATVKLNGVPITSGVPTANLPLALGTNVFNIAVVAEDGFTTKTYSITVTRGSTASSDALLSSITTNAGVALTEYAGTDYKDFVLFVPNTITSITVTPTAEDPTATIKVNGATVVSGTASAAIALPVGSTVITTVVTAQDGATVKTYGITVVRDAPPSNDAMLMKISTTADKVLSTVPGPDYKDFAVTVPNSQTSITITPTTLDQGASVKVNGVTVVNQTASPPIALAVGDTKINIVVTAQDGVTTLTYGITVTRVAGVFSTNALLTKISTNSGVVLTEVSGGDYRDYAISVPTTTSAITVTPTAADATATITVNGVIVTSGGASASIPLAAGANFIGIVVTAQDGITNKSYGIAVQRAAPSNNALLSKIATSTGAALTQVTGSDYRNYTISVPNTTSTVKITATVEDPTASIKINGVTTASGTPSASIPLAVGSTVISTVVTAQDGVTKKTYTITVTRISNNALLTKLNTNIGVALTQVTGTDYRDYTLSLSNSKASMTVTPITQDATATVKVNGIAVASGTPSAAIPLTVGNTTINTVVTAQDGTTINTYKITVTRAAMMALYAPKDSVAADGLVVHPGITPNGDGINDIFTIDGINAYPDNKVTIMGRSGAIIYEAKGYDNQTKFFDGHSKKNGSLQLPGTYFYSLEYVAGGKTKVKTGFIVLKY